MIARYLARTGYENAKKRTFKSSCGRHLIRKLITIGTFAIHKRPQNIFHGTEIDFSSLFGA
uniref:Uncharacterized protein n=1 Tax=Romanomermis culicivorax TaxID=13658 RepID=A0A915JGL0_ROMCU